MNEFGLKERSKGLGDDLEKLIRFITLGYGKRFAMWVAKLFGYEDCGCTSRQNYLNKLFPYKRKL